MNFYGSINFQTLYKVLDQPSVMKVVNWNVTSQQGNPSISFVCYRCEWLTQQLHRSKENYVFSRTHLKVVKPKIFPSHIYFLQICLMVFLYFFCRHSDICNNLDFTLSENIFAGHEGEVTLLRQRSIWQSARPKQVRC